MTMRYLKFLIAGILFGIAIYKAEVVSWFRIQEMFRFQSFHIYGIIGSAVMMGSGIIKLIKHFEIKNLSNEPIVIRDKDQSIPRYLIGGIIFGLGWVLTSACPGPMFILVGGNASFFLIAVVGALLGTFSYGLLRPVLPH
jgi:uncharacterized membrane protein YedE/YeeE